MFRLPLEMDMLMANGGCRATTEKVWSTVSSQIANLRSTSTRTIAEYHFTDGTSETFCVDITKLDPITNKKLEINISTGLNKSKLVTATENAAEYICANLSIWCSYLRQETTNRAQPKIILAKH